MDYKGHIYMRFHFDQQATDCFKLGNKTVVDSCGGRGGGGGAHLIDTHVDNVQKVWVKGRGLGVLYK